MELPIVSQSTLRIGPAVDVNSALKTHTVMNKLEVRATCTVTGKFGSRNHTSSSYERCKNPSAGETIPYQTIGTSEVPNQRSRSSQQVSIVSSSNCVSSFSVNGISPAQEECCRTPVAKRRRITANKPEREPYSELIPSEIRKAIEEQRCLRHRYIANICQQRLSSPVARRSPYVANELLFILTRELKKRRNHRPLDDLNSNAIAVNAFECSEKLNWLSSKFLMWSEDVVKRFTVFVHGAVSSMPKVLPSSSGLPAYVRDVVKTSDVCCDSSLGDCTFAIAQLSSTMQRLQFPELRLIEYDCGKLQVLSTLLRSLFHSRHRCLIFTQMSRMLDVLQAFLSFHGYQYFRLDGTTNVEQRQAMMERFNADPKIFCFILSTRSGGIGVNLTGADTVIFYDSDWNPTMDAQAQDRCHRIGQTRNVTIYRLISERTIEENILKKAMVKRRLGEMAIDEGGFTPEFFKRGDNIRDLFEGDEAVSDVIGPIAVDDDLEVEKAMEIIEDDQDVVAAKRAKAEAKAELAEFDESQHALTENSSEKANDSKYIELINQLKPIERYAINFLEAEYKPDFEKEKKEAEAMLASKKDEWIKAHENVLEEDNTGVEHDDDDFFLTYPSGFGNIDEVRKSRSSSVKTSVQNNKRGRAGVIRTSSTRHSTRIPIANQPVASCSPPTSSPKKTYANSLPTPTLFTRTSRSSTRPHSRSRKSIKPLISKRVSDLKNAARRSSRLIRAGQATQTFPQKKDCTVGPDVFLPRKRGRPSLASKLAVASSAVADVAGTGTVNFPSASAVMTPISQKTRFQCSAASGSSASTVNFEESSLNSSSIQVTTDSSNFVSSSFSSSACSQSPTFRSPPVVRLLTVSQTSDSSPDGRRLVASDMTHQPTNSIYFSPQEAFRSSARRHFVIVRRSNSVVPQQRVQLVNGLSTDNASCSSVGTSSSPPHLLKVRTRIASRHSADCNIKPSLGDYERPRLSYRKSRSSSSSCDNNVVGSSSAGTHA
ncbi:hypothetical protein AB6A40_008612 [Gnathostoma spinigerum]|uniref:Helicase C-terminal domain-containing protein n=1 Tax=Gnathostoma spinigerum TaxID=75299 RepID=A0ABD6EPW2_9BILA